MHEAPEKADLVADVASQVDEIVFHRGVRYFKDGSVHNMQSEPHGNSEIRVTGTVYGTDIYDTQVDFDIDNNTFLDFECSCPYGHNCKHGVALALEFIEEYGKRGTRTHEALNISAPKAAVMHDDPLHGLHLNIDRYDGTLTLRLDKNPYQPASVNRVLEHPGVTADIRMLCKLIQESGNNTKHNSVNIGDALILAQDNNLPIRSYEHHTPTTQGLLRINTASHKLSVTLRFDPEYKTGVFRTEPRFLLDFAQKEIDNKQYRFLGSSEHLIRISKKDITLFPMSSTLSQSLAGALRMHLFTNATTFALSESETVDIEHFKEEARIHLNFTCTLPKYTVIQHENPQKIFEVTFHRADGELSFRACVDYGFKRVDVCETVSVTQAWRGGFVHRSKTEHSPQTFYIQFDKTTIYAAKINPLLETELFSELYDFPALPLKKPKGRITKLSKILTFHDTNWKAIEQKCKDIGCTILYTADTFDILEGSFRADFDIDIQANNDWLAFDTRLYIGDNKVSLADVESFLSSGNDFFTQEDGKILHIQNRDELIRAVQMLRKFAQTNGRFEGKLYNAPELKYIATSSPSYNATQTAKFEEFCNSLYAGKPVENITFSPAHKKLLRPYQQAGVEWLYFLRSHHFAGILADDMGLGKTLQTLVLLERETIKGTPSIVVCPKTLIYNWQAEAAKFAPKLKVAVIDGTAKEREALIQDAKKYDLLITGYASYKLDALKYRQNDVQFNYCVIDEAQSIKNHNTKNAQIIKEIDAKWRLALTGTPIENSVGEIWSMFDFLMPGFLGTHQEFTKNFYTPIMKGGNTEVLVHLRKKIECFMLRRTKDEVLTELPPKVIQESKCHLSDDQNILYQEVLARVKEDITTTVAQKGFERSGIHILAGITKLRQICNHPNLLMKENDYTQFPSTKLDMFNELVHEARENNRKVLVFSQFTGMLDILAKELDSSGIKHHYLSGKTKNRQELVDEFNNDPTIPVFLISLKAGGTGLNLTSADTVIIFDPWWNPSVENQAIDRAHRMGQKNSVNVYKLVTTGTIEEKILALQAKKQNLFNALVSESKDTFKKLTWEDVQELFTS